MLALSDLTVVEYGRYVSGPFCARLLADAGARVIKIEDPRGDPTRGWGPFPGGEPDPERSGAFHFLNAGKTSATLDLDDAEDRARLDELLAAADIFIDNLEPPERERWSLDFESLIGSHSHLVSVSLSPYGRSGALAGRAGTDLTASAAAALPVGLGEPDREPLRIPFDQADYQAGVHAAAAALCAVRESRRSGLGQGVDVSTAQVLGYCVGGMHLVVAKTGVPWQRRPRTQLGIFPSGLFDCKDGPILIASQSPKQWAKVVKAMGSPDWAPAKVDSPPPAEIDEKFRAWLSDLTRNEAVQKAMEADITLGVINTVEDVLREEQLAERGLWSDLELGETTVKAPKPAYVFSRTPVDLGRSGPRIGSADIHLSPRRTPEVALEAPRSLPLSDVRILEFAFNWAGPMAGQLLADMGADVIKVETSKRQDLMRFLPWTSWFFSHNHRNKKSITIDASNPESAGLMANLVQRCDIVLDNFRPGVMEKLGLSYEQLRVHKPDIIAVSMSMAGQEGPLRLLGGFASIATGFAGLESLVGYEDGAAPGLLAFGLGDVNVAVQGALATLIALHHKERTGEGQLVDVSQIDASVSTMGEALIAHQLDGVVPGQLGNTHHVLSPHGIFATEDGRWIAITVREDAEWRALCDSIGHADWSSDEAYSGHRNRSERREEIHAAIAHWCAKHARDDAQERLWSRGVPACAVLELPERDQHPHFRDRNFVLEHPGDDSEMTSIYGTPWLFTETGPQLTRPSPALGEHNDEVFKELLGLDAREVERLVASGVIA